MQRKLLTALVVAMTWVGFDGSGHVGSIALAHELPPGIPQCWVTGGGRVDIPGDGFFTFGLNAVAPHHTLITGHITLVEHNILPCSGPSCTTAFFCRVTELRCACAPTEGPGAGSEGVAQLIGTLFQLGEGAPTEIGPCSVTVADFGEPGRNDTIALDQFDDLSGFFSTLNHGGNIQIHGCKEHGNG